MRRAIEKAACAFGTFSAPGASRCAASGELACCGFAANGRSPRGVPVLPDISAIRQSPEFAVPYATVASRRERASVRFASRGTRSVLALRAALRMRLCACPCTLPA